MNEAKREKVKTIIDEFLELCSRLGGIEKIKEKEGKYTCVFPEEKIVFFRGIKYEKGSEDAMICVKDLKEKTGLTSDCITINPRNFQSVYLQSDSKPFGVLYFDGHFYAIEPDNRGLEFEFESYPRRLTIHYDEETDILLVYMEDG